MWIFHVSPAPTAIFEQSPTRAVSHALTRSWMRTICPASWDVSDGFPKSRAYQIRHQLGFWSLERTPQSPNGTTQPFQRKSGFFLVGYLYQFSLNPIRKKSIGRKEDRMRELAQAQSCQDLLRIGSPTPCLHKRLPRCHRIPSSSRDVVETAMCRREPSCVESWSFQIFNI